MNGNMFLLQNTYVRWREANYKLIITFLLTETEVFFVYDLIQYIQSEMMEMFHVNTPPKYSYFCILIPLCIFYLSYSVKELKSTDLESKSKESITLLNPALN